jgi:hypothetical protein
MTETTAIIVSVEPTPLEPVIDYEIVSMKEDNNTVVQKIIFSCGNSKGSNIDFTQSRWSVPVAAEYGEEVKQTGPTAIYTLRNFDSTLLLETTLTLVRHGGTDTATTIKAIRIAENETVNTELRVNVNREATATEESIVFDVLSSTGPNIDWEKTEWLLDSHYTRKGPVARLDVNETGDDLYITYTCTLYIHGSAPLKKTGQILKKAEDLKPLIDTKNLGGKNNLFELSVTKTLGINIDWARTMWYIYDGNDTVIQKQRATVLHSFVIKSETYGYPVMVEMYYKDSTAPFVGYKSVDVGGEELRPIITCNEKNPGWEEDAQQGDTHVFIFSAETSQGSNIDWSQAKWTFGDSSEVQYGPVVVHEYAASNLDKIYRVSLTLMRRAANGTVMETKTSYRTVKIGKDEVKAVVKAQVYNNSYLVLSAEESQGKGLMLDRCVWTFPGKGDSESYTDNYKDGVITKDNWFVSGKIGIEAGKSGGNDGGPFCKFYAETSGGWNRERTDYSEYKGSSKSFSNQNIHTGVVCRRTIKSMDEKVIVTLFVYRIAGDGSVEGESITIKVNLNKASTSVNQEGVTYGK